MATVRSIGKVVLPTQVEPAVMVACAGAKVATEAAFELWLQGSRPSDRFVYAVGVWLPKPAIAPVIGAVRTAYDDGWVLFTQARRDDGQLSYIAVRRKDRLAPVMRFVPRGGGLQ
jgi:hypothetical protein